MDLQEVAVSKNATIYCGLEKIGWKFIHDLSKAIVSSNLVCIIRRKESNQDADAVTDALTLLHSDNVQTFLIATIREEYIDRNQQDLETLTLRISNSKASDGRDRIFAIMVYEQKCM